MVGRGIRFTMDCLREKNHYDIGQAILGKKHKNEYKSEKMVLGGGNTGHYALLMGKITVTLKQ